MVALYHHHSELPQQLTQQRKLVGFRLQVMTGVYQNYHQEELDSLEAHPGIVQEEFLPLKRLHLVVDQLQLLEVALAWINLVFVVAERVKILLIGLLALATQIRVTEAVKVLLLNDMHLDVNSTMKWSEPGTEASITTL